MKLYQIDLLLLFISYVYADTDCVLIANPTKKSDCNEKLSEADKNKNIKYCCYVEVGDTYKQCLPYTQEDYDAIGKAKKESTTTISSSDVKGKIECTTQYLTFGIISLLFFLL